VDTTVGALYDKHLNSDSECVEKECNVLVLLWLQASSFITISFLSYRPIISEQPSYFDRFLPEKKNPLQFYMQMLLITFQVHLMFRRTEHFTIALVAFLSGNMIFEMYSSVDVFFLALESI